MVLANKIKIMKNMLFIILFNVVPSSAFSQCISYKSADTGITICAIDSFCRCPNRWYAYARYGEMQPISLSKSLPAKILQYKYLINMMRLNINDYLPLDVFILPNKNDIFVITKNKRTMKVDTAIYKFNGNREKPKY